MYHFFTTGNFFPFFFLLLFHEGHRDVLTPCGLLGPIPVSSIGEGQGTPWMSCQLIAGPLTDGRHSYTRWQLHIRNNFWVQYLAQGYFYM